ncbi:FadR/GntR family transcriptional regulator [Caballeronia ptereochthonis]|uniref:GntR family transcriptional regulator n=1 Tax=Caballeronia ptereochthonis TaxID=1777144 RepID=A0A158CC85_9BURK|nr:GntR family transcriptional regulator [Caballeronia ptereochthonis]SAK79978.1 GntR family transcriptional regulator [Caballeronia ptereochthonis]
MNRTPRRAAATTPASAAPAATAAPARPAPAYSPVQTRRAFEVVADQIRSQLANGALQPGDRLPSERELAESFGLSRNTVREALRSLEIAGVLEFRKGATGGAFVREGQGDAVIAGFSDMFRLGAIKPADLTEARLIVSVAAARFACLRGNEEDFEALRENVRESEAAVAKGDVRERVRINLEFHRLLARAARNPVLVILTDALVEIHEQLLEVLAPLPDSSVMPSRKRLLKHLMARDEEKAAAEMETHLKSLQKHYLSQTLDTKRAG